MGSNPPKVPILTPWTATVDATAAPALQAALTTALLTAAPSVVERWETVTTDDPAVAPTLHPILRRSAAAALRGAVALVHDLADGNETDLFTVTLTSDGTAVTVQVRAAPTTAVEGVRAEQSARQ